MSHVKFAAMSTDGNLILAKVPAYFVFMFSSEINSHWRPFDIN